MTLKEAGDSAVATGLGAAPTRSPIDAAIEAWFIARIANSVVSRNTEIFNYVRAEVDDLKRRLAKEI